MATILSILKRSFYACVIFVIAVRIFHVYISFVSDAKANHRIATFNRIDQPGDTVMANTTIVPQQNQSNNLSFKSTWDYKISTYYRKRPYHGIRTLYPLTLTSPYLINSPDVCKNVTNLAFLTIVHTATHNFKKRRIIRETWANKNLFKNISTRIVFVFGWTKNKIIQDLLVREQNIHGDIVQGDFLDHYHNLTHKGILAFRWISEYCNHSKLIVKVDDDVFVNPFLLIQDIIPKHRDSDRFMMCHSRGLGSSGIMRGKLYQWGVENDEFRGYKTFPVVHCFGFFVIISPDIIESLYRASSFTPFFWIDDVYLYGLLPFQIGNVNHENIEMNISRNSHYGKQCYRDFNPCHIMVITSPNIDTHEEIWRMILKNLTKEQKELVRDEYILGSS
ncbi:hypothetical protein SNE40_006486 [Patella caerulea]|uniref:Hexosyltransferase n=1 Tax=Patella caerulea TaxID=87958 RepID=A0AAN8JU48_PATCE